MDNYLAYECVRDGFLVFGLRIWGRYGDLESLEEIAYIVMVDANFLRDV